MGAIHSKRKFSITKRIRKGKSRTRGKPAVDFNEEPVYMEIDEADGLFYARNHRTTESLDSAFSERSTSLDTNWSSCTIYDTPGRRETHPKICCQNLQNTYHYDDDDDSVYDDTHYDDTHAYIYDGSISTALIECSTVALDDIPFMVEAFQPLIEQTVNAMEVVVHMPFLDRGEFVNKENPKEAVALLIATMKMSDEQGKWQSFLHALNEAGYEYIVQLLRGETDEDHTINCNLLKLFTPQIMNRIDPEEFIDHLFEQRVINELDMEEVRCERDKRGAIAASLMLLHKVPRRLCNWYEIFLEVLKKCGMKDMVQQFKIPEVSIEPKRKPSVTKTKLNVAEKRKYRDSGSCYITPIYDKETKIASLPSQTIPLLHHAASIPPSIPVCLPINATPCRDSKQKDNDRDSKFTSNIYPKSEIDILSEKKEELKRRVEERKLIKQYKIEVKRLQRELKQLTSSSDEEGSIVEYPHKWQNAREALDSKPEIRSDNTSNESGVQKTTEENNTGEMDEKKTTVTNESSENSEINNSCANVDGQISDEQTGNYNPSMGEYMNAEGRVTHEQKPHNDEQIALLFTDMKQELKQEILAMRDHLTETVMKFIINSRDLPAYEDNAYVTVCEDPTTIPGPMKLYNTACIPHVGLLNPQPHQLYAVDSAMFSDYGYTL